MTKYAFSYHSSDHRYKPGYDCCSTLINYLENQAFYKKEVKNEKFPSAFSPDFNYTFPINIDRAG